jgi:[ribosomal protein S5]-alanine N-acetyltransferase
MLQVKLETDRIFIRPIDLNDKEFILCLLNTEGWLKYIGERNVHDLVAAEQFIQDILKNGKVTCHVFGLKKDNIQAGIVTFIYRDSLEFPDIGFALLPEFENQGLTFEASQIFLQEIRRLKITSRLCAITQPNNKGSIRLIEKLGLNYVKDFVDQKDVLSLYVIDL